MKKNILLFLILLILAGIALTAAKLPPSSYRSPWQTVPPGQVALFSHPIGKEPDLLFVWIKLNPDDLTVRPWTELPGLILVNSVDDEFITVQNGDETEWQISIYVR